jgi:crotonobetainyl-CoA:carnitine CoA-transferase CaiB-like acyl-CoA transferase
VDERPDEASAGRGGPLAGIRVIELGRYISAPFAGRLLGDLGADVIKVEAPDGDPMRWLPVGDRQSSPQFASYNRNKRSITLDLKQPAALSMLGALVASADVLLHNLRPDALSRAGLDEQALSREHPRLVICGISGYGLVGEYAGAQGYDVVVSGLSGLFSQFLDLDQPRVVGPSLTDLITGLFAVQSVLAALVHRERSGEGQAVAVTMLDAAMNVINDAVVTHAETGHAPDRDSRQRRQHAFACIAGDDRPFIVHLSVVPARWAAFLEVLGHPDWERDPRFASYPERCANFDDLDALVKAECRTRPRAQWLSALAARDLACGPLNTIAEAMAEGQVADLGVLENLPDPGGAPVTMVRPAGTFAASPVAPSIGAPAPGADTVDLLAELSLPDDVREAVRETWMHRRVAR